MRTIGKSFSYSASDACCRLCDSYQLKSQFQKLSSTQFSVFVDCTFVRVSHVQLCLGAAKATFLDLKRVMIDVREEWLKSNEKRLSKHKDHTCDAYVAVDESKSNI